MMKSVFSVFGIFAALFLVEIAPIYAQSISISQTEIVDGNTPITITISGLSVDQRLVNWSPNEYPGFEYWYTAFNNGTYTGAFDDVMGTGGQNPTNFGIWSFMVLNDYTNAANDPACDTSLPYIDCKNSVYFDSEILINITQFTENGGGSMFPNGGFLGSSASGAAMVGRVISGVTTTGESVWPLLGLFGIPLAFIIGMTLISFIHNATRSKSGKVDTKTVNGSEALGGKNYRTYGDKEIAKAKRDGLL
jgi:hypothetical protein